MEESHNIFLKEDQVPLLEMPDDMVTTAETQRKLKGK